MAILVAAVVAVWMQAWPTSRPSSYIAAPVFGRRATPPSTIVPSSPPALMGTYVRTFQDADLRVVHRPHLDGWVGAILTITINNGWIHFALPTGGTIDEFATATQDGRLTLFGYLPTDQPGFCSDDSRQMPPTGYYRWSLKKHILVITRIKDDQCLDRPGIMPGRWTKI
jgi:hypothetical protein